jgi:iron complex transport system permease protein
MNAATKSRRRACEDAPPRRARHALPLLAMSLPLACLAGLACGAYPLHPGEIVAILLNAAGFSAAVPFDERQAAVLLEIRLPRVILAVVAGAGLGLAGAVTQGLFRNPLADPGLMGVTSGAAVGAALYIVFGPPRFFAPFFLPEILQSLAAFGGGLGATLCVYRLSRREGRVSLTLMLLAGIAVNALAGAAIGLLSYLSTDEQLRNLAFWSLGSLARADWNMLAALILLVAPSGALLLTQSAALNVMLLGDAEARHLGVDPHRAKRLGVVLGALIVGALVSVSGMIGFVGLAAPHLVRLAVGPDHRQVLPGSALCGATLLAFADLAARTAAAPAEIPIGIVTALLGAPFFLWLLGRRSAEGDLS